MAQGFWGRILRVDLTHRTVATDSPDPSFYRTYLGGSALGTYYLLKETLPETDPLAAENLLTIAPSITTGARVSGASRCCVTALSPLTGAVGDGQTGGSIGPAIKRAGYDAIVISGRADSPVYLEVDEQGVQFRDASHLVGQKVSEVLDQLGARSGDRSASVLQCGPAGERKVRFACLVADRNDVVGRTGLGAVFGSKNLRAVVVRGKSDVPFADPAALAALNKKAAVRLPQAGFPSTLRKYGTPGVLGFQTEAGNLSTANYSRGFHPDYKQLTGQSFEPVYGAGSTTCFGCVVGCRKRMKADGPYPITDRLGGPEFETLGLLGANLLITDPVVVGHANELCNEYGLDTISTGGAIAYLLECLERGLIPAAEVGGWNLSFGHPESLFWLIEAIAHREGIGDVLAEGLAAAVKRYGAETEPYAICVKNQSLAAHMAQVKPSQALMYAVCPFGADHQSSEHDWLLASGGEDCRGLGIVGQGDARSSDLAKVRMTAYSQYYYSLMDTLCLCMFVWGPGNLFTYGELEELVSAATGWQATFWELMKAGERRVNLMRQLNARRGFGRRDDRLPGRLFEPLPDGPSEGRRVDPETFPTMLEQYYQVMGWDPATGNPTAGKLMELGLEWTI
ncbi:MAG: aldehyde ferredoxin oxidoreductase family protein [Bradymonadales bacterium]|nr:aldehyde ferredoxin oxidoreductase family protein [Bradymonadales bacterium]